MFGIFLGLGLQAQTDLHVGLSGVNIVKIRTSTSPGDVGSGLAYFLHLNIVGEGPGGQDLFVWGRGGDRDF